MQEDGRHRHHRLTHRGDTTTWSSSRCNCSGLVNAGRGTRRPRPSVDSPAAAANAVLGWHCRCTGPWLGSWGCDGARDLGPWYLPAQSTRRHDGSPGRDGLVRGIPRPPQRGNHRPIAPSGDAAATSGARPTPCSAVEMALGGTGRRPTRGVGASQRGDGGYRPARGGAVPRRRGRGRPSWSAAWPLATARRH